MLSKCIYLHAPRAAGQGPLQVRLRRVADHRPDTSCTACLQESFLSATAPPHSTELRLGAAAAAAPAMRLRLRVAGSVSRATSQLSGGHNISAHQGGVRAGGAQRTDTMQLPLRPQHGQPGGPVKGAGTPHVCTNRASNLCLPAFVRSCLVNTPFHFYLTDEFGRSMSHTPTNLSAEHLQLLSLTQAPVCGRGGGGADGTGGAVSRVRGSALHHLGERACAGLCHELGRPHGTAGQSQLPCGCGAGP